MDSPSTHTGYMNWALIWLHVYPQREHCNAHGAFVGLSFRVKHYMVSIELSHVVRAL